MLFIRSHFCSRAFSEKEGLDPLEGKEEILEIAEVFG